MSPTGEIQRVIRPAAVLHEHAAQTILDGLSRIDVSRGGVWSTSTTLWQRYDRPWDGLAGMRGQSQLMGSLAVIYGSPTKGAITVYRVTVTPAGADAGMSVETLCDEAFGFAYLTLANCPRADLHDPPVRDPFHARRATAG